MSARRQMQAFMSFHLAALAPMPICAFHGTTIYLLSLQYFRHIRRAHGAMPTPYYAISMLRATDGLPPVSDDAIFISALTHFTAAAAGVTAAFEDDARETSFCALVKAHITSRPHTCLMSAASSIKRDKMISRLEMGTRHARFLLVVARWNNSRRNEFLMHAD